jgi:hypothetical protein
MENGLSATLWTGGRGWWTRPRAAKRIRSPPATESIPLAFRLTAAGSRSRIAPVGTIIAPLLGEPYWGGPLGLKGMNTDRVEVLPGVRAAGTIQFLPLGGWHNGGPFHFVDEPDLSGPSKLERCGAFALTHAGVAPWGFATGESRGARTKTITLLLVGIGFLILGFVTVALAARLG